MRNSKQRLKGDSVFEIFAKKFVKHLFIDWNVIF